MNRKLRVHSLIMLSAGAGALAFVYPPILWCLAFIFLMPLFYSQGRMQLPAPNGFVWGNIFFGLHFMAVIPLLIRMREGWSSIFGYLALVLFFSLFSALWFWLANFIKRVTGASATISFAVASFFFFTFLYRACLFLFGRVEGIIFLYPLIPLAQMPQTLVLLPWIGAEGLLACLIGLQSLRRWSWIFIIPFLMGISGSRETD